MIRNTSAGNASELAWFKSSYSSGSEGDSCVEVALDWFKSSYATCPDTIHVRDSKHTAGPQLALAPQAWADFVTYASRD